MTNPLSDPEGKVDQWLYDRGFVLGNPFKKTAADDERELPIEELFVPIGDYDRIRGNETVLVFAPRGAGKSTLRIRLAAISQPQDVSAATLAIECTDFSWLVSRYRQYQQVTEEDYQLFLLRQAAKTLLELFLPLQSIPATIDAENDFHKREQKAREVTPIVRAQISAFLRRYFPALLSARELFNYMLRLSSDFNGEWLEFQDAANQQKLKGYLAKTNLAPKLYVAWLLADLCDEAIAIIDEYRSVIDAFKEFVQIARAVQIKQVHFLVDRLDEMQLFANDYAAQADILEPLLAYLNLLELDGVAFKFFIARELYQVLLDRTAVRRDRLLINKAMTIQWSEANLKLLLQNRLRYFSQEEVPSLVLLCDGKGESIEADLLSTAMGSPRRLLTGGQLLVKAHVTNPNTKGLITQPDWQTAKVQLLQLIPPTLQLRLDERLVVRASVEISLTKTEVKILHALVAYDGYCPRERLIEQVWGADQGVSDDAVSQAFKRLRDKLGETESTAVYLHVLRGANPGFRLENFAQAD